MAQIEHAPETHATKQQLNGLPQPGPIKDWEIPYESMLTRLTAAILFLDQAGEAERERSCGGD